MDKQGPDGPAAGPVPPRLRQSTEVRVSLAATADGLGAMVWIAAEQESDGSSVRGDQMNELGLGPPAILECDILTGDDQRVACQRGGFGWTGGQFYKPEEEA